MALPVMCLKLADVPPDGLVLDPFAGTGSTLVAAQKLGLLATVIDIDSSYCAAARRRLGQDSEAIADTAQ